MIRLSVPGTLDYRDVAMRVVTAAAKLTHSVGTPHTPGVGGETTQPEDDEFDAQVVSAFGEAFNNIAIHGYADGAAGSIDVEIDLSPGELVIRIMDQGETFDPLQVPPPDMLPERGMGVFIIRNFMSDVSYTPGTPNVLVMKKRWTVQPLEEVPAGPKPGPRSGTRLRAPSQTAWTQATEPAVGRRAGRRG